MQEGMGPSGNGGRNKRRGRGATHGGRHLQLLVGSEAMYSIQKLIEEIYYTKLKRRELLHFLLGKKRYVTSVPEIHLNFF